MKILSGVGVSSESELSENLQVNLSLLVTLVSSEISEVISEMRMAFPLRSVTLWDSRSWFNHKACSKERVVMLTSWAWVVCWS